jgi:Ca2+-binding RTX toxin-like protein
MYMLVNLGLGGFTGTPDAAVLDAGVQMKVDYIRAYGFEPDAAPDNGGDDSLTGTAAADTLDGGDGNDLLRGLAGDDLLLGGAGDETLQGGMGSDTYDGGSGSDTVSYSGTNKSVFVDLAAGIARPYDGTEILISIENAISGNAGDTLHGDDGANALSGGAGDDLLDGGLGADRFHFAALDLAGGDGQDVIRGFERSADILSFSDLVDANDDGTIALDDLLASVTSVTDTGSGGNVAVAFDNGASITFTGVGTGAVDSLTDLVNDAATQIQVS